MAVDLSIFLKDIRTADGRRIRLSLVKSYRRTAVEAELRVATVAAEDRVVTVTDG